ncbi:hypothetical protein GWK47_008159 [Chionoecetes opilio]|uniref:Uncharacterized protein n=1 Tax=Chionoecetes opilio TaxID=41210 RepID=A0A8J5CRJ4_CHIOP|nr:hypothetical protein GWK47_008159 [Chionoecetes opilio]
MGCIAEAAACGTAARGNPEGAPAEGPQQQTPRFTPFSYLPRMFLGNREWFRGTRKENPGSTEDPVTKPFALRVAFRVTAPKQKRKLSPDHRRVDGGFGFPFSGFLHQGARP